MPDLATNLLLCVAVFAGAFVSSLASFAFSAVAGAILLRIFQPMEAMPLMMACSIGVQAANLWALRRKHPVGRQPALDRRWRARHPDCDLPAAECGHAHSPGSLRDHRRHLCRLYTVPADAGARRRNSPAGISRR
ncbi:hypothetical protein V1283_008430 [Bradyrhizobium sp. AZCC 2262]